LSGTWASSQLPVDARDTPPWPVGVHPIGVPHNLIGRHDAQQVVITGQHPTVVGAASTPKSASDTRLADAGTADQPDQTPDALVNVVVGPVPHGPTLRRAPPCTGNGDQMLRIAGCNSSPPTGSFGLLGVVVTMALSASAGAASDYLLAGQSGRVEPVPVQPISEMMTAFLVERHLATLTTLRSDGSPHVVPVGFSYDASAGVVRVITFASSVKARNAARGGRAAVTQVDGRRWATLEGDVRLVTDDESVALAVAGYAARYRQPRARADRVAIEISVDRLMGSV
jgi:PPOX class probable F420-dependent enzyme